MTKATAAGKIILLGEHAVVYNRPAIAVPVSDLRATAKVTTAPAGSGILITALDLNESYRLDQEADSDAACALQTTVRNTLQHIGVDVEDAALHITVFSQIPIARGMGSGAALATALVRALVQHYDHYTTSRVVSDLVYQTEIIFHGTPSGIDNTVVAYEKPVYYVKNMQADIFWVGKPFTLVIADTGVPSRTRDAVEDVRQKWLADRAHCESLFDAIGDIVDRGKQAISRGMLGELGMLMNHNQRLLSELGVSSTKLDRLIAVARSAGALGAKLSGGGKGGCMIALVDEAMRNKVSAALLLAGVAEEAEVAAQIIPTVVH